MRSREPVCPDVVQSSFVVGKQANAGEISQDAVTFVQAGNFLGHSDFVNFNQIKNPDFDFNRADNENPAVPGNLGVHFRDRETNFREARKAIDSCDSSQFELEMHGVQDYHTHWAKGFTRGHKSPGVIWRSSQMATTANYTAVLGGKYYLSPDLDNAAHASANNDTKTLLREWKSKCCVTKSGGFLGFFATKSWMKRSEETNKKCCLKWKDENWE